MNTISSNITARRARNHSLIWYRDMFPMCVHRRNGNRSPMLCHARLQQKMRIISQLRCSRLCALYTLITFGTAGFAQTAVPVNQPASPVATTVANGPDSKPILPGVDSAVRLGAGDL